MKIYKLFCVVFISLLVIVACTTAPEPTPTPEPPPPPTPTVPPPPTEQPTPEPTATPVGQIFRDDFVADLQPGWIWINEIPDRHSLSNKGLRIVADDTCLLGDRYQSNLLMYPAPEGISFEVETKITADTTRNFQQASLYLFEDTQNYYSVNRGFCDLCVLNGDGIYSDYMYRDEINFGFKGRAIDTDTIYLKLEVNREDNWLINYYATEPGEWIQLRKVPILINIQQVGIGAANCEQEPSDEDLLAFFDYFEIRELQ